MGSNEVILLDTHVLIWISSDSKKLSRAAAATIRRARLSDGVAVSAITLWELAGLLQRGKIQSYGTVEHSIRLLIQDVTVKQITPEIAALAAVFPDDYSRDPADRLIGATARAEGLAVVTRDENMRRSPLLHTIW
jgi:PIN domain nuclease of toxin-antitoxin system